MSNKCKTEEFKVSGEDLMAKIKTIIKEGNARKITIKGKDEETIVSFPVTVGIVGIVLAPVLAAIGAITAIVTECTIIVER